MRLGHRRRTRGEAARARLRDETREGEDEGVQDTIEIERRRTSSSSTSRSRSRRRESVRRQNGTLLITPSTRRSPSSSTSSSGAAPRPTRYCRNWSRAGGTHTTTRAIRPATAATPTRTCAPPCWATRSRWRWPTGGPARPVPSVIVAGLNDPVTGGSRSDRRGVTARSRLRPRMGSLRAAFHRRAAGPGWPHADGGSLTLERTR